MRAAALAEVQTFHARRGKFFLIGGLMAVAALIGLVLGLGGSWEGWAIFAFAVLIAGFCGLLALPQFLWLKVGPDGFAFRSGFRTRRYRWSEVWDFRIPPPRKAGRRWSQTVIFDFSPNGPTTRSGKLRGWDEFLPDTFGHEPEDLAGKMQAWRQAAAGF